MSSTLSLKILLTGVGFGTVAASFGTLSERVNKLGLASEKTQARMKALGLETVDAFREQKKVTEEANAKLEKHKAATTELGRAQAQAKTFQTESTKALEAYRAEIVRQDTKPTEAQSLKLKLLREQATGAEKDFKKLSKEFETARERGKGLQEQVLAQTYKLQKLRDELNANGISTAKLVDHRLRITRQIEKEQIALDRLTKRYERLKAVQEDVSKYRGELAERQTNMLAAVGIGASLAVPVVATAKFDDKIKQISITGELYKEAGAEAALGQAVRLAAIKHGVSHDNVATGVERLVAQGMDAKQAGGYAGMLASVAKATRADMGDLAELTYTLQTKFKLKTEGEIFEAINALAKAGKLGQYEIRQMAKAFPELGGAAASFGSTGLAGVKEMGALMQTMRAGAGSAGEAETYMRNWFSHMSANSTQDKFGSVGIDFEKSKLAKVQEGAGRVSNVEASFMVFDDYINKVVESGKVVAYKKNGKVKSSTDMKAELTAALALAKKDGLQGEALANYMQSAVRRVGLSSVLQDIQATQAYLAWMTGKETYKDNRATLDKAETKQTIANDEAQQNETNAAKWENLKTAMMELAIVVGDQLSPTVGQLLDGLTSMAQTLGEFSKEHPTLLKVVTLAAVGIAGLVAAILALGVAASVARLGLAGFRGIPLLGRLAGSPGSGGKASTAIKSKFVKPTVPWIKGGGGGGFATMSKAASGMAAKSAAQAVAASGGVLAKLKPLGALAGRAAMPLSVGMALFGAGSALANDGISQAAKGSAVGSAAGGLAGGLAGAKLGALVGTAVFPGLGTVIGGLLGGLAGSTAGDWLGGKLGGKVAGADKPKTPDLPTQAKAAVAAAKPPAPIEVKMEYKPQITIHGDPTPQSQQRFKEMLQSHQQTLEAMLRRLLAEQTRRGY
jgi:hypothetical protein